MGQNVQNYPRKLLSDLELAIRAVKALRGKPDGFVGTDPDGFATLTHLASGTPTASTVLRGDGTWAITAGSNISTVKLTADETYTSTSMVSSALTFAVTNGTYYHFHHVLLLQTSLATCGPKLSVISPTFTTYGALVSCAVAEGANFNASGDILTMADLPAASTTYVATIHGSILPSASGNLTLQVGIETATGSPTVTLKRGSAGVLTVVP